MSASYTRVNWADYPATTTPVNAENLNKMDAGIAGLTSEINSVESDVSALNSSLTAQDNTMFNFQKVNGAYGYLDDENNFRAFGGGYMNYTCGVAGSYSNQGYTTVYMFEVTCDPLTFRQSSLSLNYGSGTVFDNEWVTITFNGSPKYFVATFHKDGWSTSPTALTPTKHNAGDVVDLGTAYGNANWCVYC